MTLEQAIQAGVLQQQFSRDDVALAMTDLRAARMRLQTLNQLAPNRKLSVAITQLETSELWTKSIYDEMGN